MISACDAGVEFAQRGWAVLPVRRRTKRPLLNAWPDRATTDEKMIRDWFQRYRSAGLGVLAGLKSGIAVLDVERENLDALQQWAADREIPETLRIISGGGGVHYYFTIDRPFPKRKVEGIGDLQGERSYVVAPPSTHTTGNRYEFDFGHGFDTPVAPMPEWLREDN
jgi:hypothetical protein